MINNLHLNLSYPPLVDAIFHTIGEENRSPSISCNEVSQRILKAAISLECIAGASTFIAVAKEYANDNTPLYISCATASVITYSALDIWAYFKWINVSTTSPVYVKYNLANNCASCKFTSLKISTLIGGLIAQLPLAYVAYTDNNNSLPAFFLLLFASAGIPAFSLLSSISSKVPRHLSNQELLLSDMQKNLCKLISKKISNLLAGPRSNQLAILEKICNQKDFQNLDTAKEIIKDLFILDETHSTPSRVRHFGELTAQTIGIISACSRLILFGAIAYTAGSSLSDKNPIALGSITALTVVASTGHITFSVLTNVSKRIYNSSISYFQCNRTPSLASILHPHITLIKILPNVTFSILTLLPLLDLPKDYLPFPEQVILSIKVGFALGTFFLYTNALNDLADQLLSHPRWTDEEGKKLIQLYSGLNRLEKTIKNSSLLNIALLLEFCSEDVLKDFFTSFKLSRTVLEEYISENIQKIDSQQESYPLLEEV